MQSLAQLADGHATQVRWAEGKCQGRAEVGENQSRAGLGKGQRELAENSECLGKGQSWAGLGESQTGWA